MDDVQLLKIIPPVVDLLTPPHHIRSLASPQHASRVREEARNPGALTEALQVSPVKMRVKREVVTPKRGWRSRVKAEAFTPKRVLRRRDVGATPSGKRHLICQRLKFLYNFVSFGMWTEIPRSMTCHYYIYFVNLCKTWRCRCYYCHHHRHHHGRSHLQLQPTSLPQPSTHNYSSNRNYNHNHLCFATTIMRNRKG